MVDRVEVFDVVVAAGTPSSAPATTALAYPGATVTEVRLTFPDGCVGLVGVRLAYGGEQTIPNTDGSWLRGNNRVVSYAVHNFPSADRYQLVAYNSDRYDHVITIEFLLDEYVPTQQTTPAPMEIPAEV